MDPLLINAWGITYTPTGPFWITDTGTGFATVYGSKGVNKKIVVTIPSIGKKHGTPTGEVYNGTSDFKISQGSNSGPAVFMFCTEDGTVSGWNPSVNATTAVIAAKSRGADYEGLAIGVNNGANFIYAADHKNNKVDIYDGSFNLVSSFTDTSLPPGAAPFNVQNIKGQLFVAFTLSGESGGVVDIFDTAGNMIKTFASHGTLNGPWGLALAPSNFGPASGAILIGNLIDGRINIFDATTGKYMGQLEDTSGKVISVQGLVGADLRWRESDQRKEEPALLCLGAERIQAWSVRRDQLSVKHFSYRLPCAGATGPRPTRAVETARPLRFRSGRLVGGCQPQCSRT